MLGGTALSILSIVGLVKFTYKNNRKTGMAAVIILTVVSESLITRAITNGLKNAIKYNIDFEIYFGSLTPLFIFVSCGLLIAFFACHSLFPVNAEAPSKLNEN